MRPKAVRHDIPSTHDITTYIRNEFVKWLNELKGEIEVNQVKSRQKHYLPGHNRILRARYQPQLMDGRPIPPSPRSLE
jgi:hypothetical protein